MAAADQIPDRMFDGYEPRSGAYDEMFAGPGQLRPHWERLEHALAQLGPAEFRRRWTQAQRLVHENGIAYSAFGDPQEKARPWQLDPLPIIIPAREWQTVAEGLRQRAQLFNLILTDLYGPQDLLRQNLVPPELLFRHPGFHRPFHGQKPKADRFLHLYAADLARSPNGRWWVLGDRTEAPSGSGYALENRIVVSRMLPEPFRVCHVHRLAPYFIALRETLRELSPHQIDNPRVALLSQGPSSPNYFEDAYLSRYLGYTLAQGDDLAVRNDQVMLKTLGGLLKIDVLLRRPNSEHCDSLELSGRSRQGTPGLLQAVRSNQVLVANTLGSGLVESPIFLALLPALCQALLGEPLKIPGVATWWCGDEQSLKYVLARLEKLIIRPAFRQRGSELEASRRLHQLSSDALRSEIEQKPWAYVAQERVQRSTAPAWRAGGVEPKHIALRSFAVASDDSYTVMAGGLGRISDSVDPLFISLLAGEGSKDVWVQGEKPVRPVSLLERSSQSLELRRTGAELPSRVADHIYWLGRHLERADATARLLRTVALRLTGENSSASTAELPVLLRVLVEQGQIEPGFVVEGIAQQLPRIETHMPRAVFDVDQPFSLRSVISNLFRSASVVRDRISVDSWRIVHRMDEGFRPRANGTMDLTDVMATIDQLLIDLSSFSGMVMESMTRTHTWRFLDLGRRLERALQTITLLHHALQNPAQVASPLLEALLETCDSQMTYRSRYLANIQLAAVLDLLLTDETNPRSVAFQLVRIAGQVDKLPRDRVQAVYSREQRIAMSVLHTVQMLDIQALADMYNLNDSRSLLEPLRELETRLPELSDAISHKYLIHAGPSHQLAELRPG